MSFSNDEPFDAAHGKLRRGAGNSVGTHCYAPGLTRSADAGCGEDRVRAAQETAKSLPRHLDDYDGAVDDVIPAASVTPGRDALAHRDASLRG